MKCALIGRRLVSLSMTNYGIPSVCWFSTEASETLRNITHTAVSGRKRFYKTVDCRENGDHFNIYLDDKILKSPARADLDIPNKTMAMIIAAEWDGQNSFRGIQPTSMPFMILASTAIDQVLVDKSYVKNTCLSYLPTDTALFFTSEEDRLLLAKQKQHFEHLIDWTNKKFGLELAISKDAVMKLQHPSSCEEKFANIIDSMDCFTLACLQALTMECKSLVMALAGLHGYLSAQDMITLSRLEEELQCEIWGVVEGGHDLDRLHNKIRISSALLFHTLLNERK